GINRKKESKRHPRQGTFHFVSVYGLENCSTVGSNQSFVILDACEPEPIFAPAKDKVFRAFGVLGHQQKVIGADNIAEFAMLCIIAPKLVAGDSGNDVFVEDAIIILHELLHRYGSQRLAWVIDIVIVVFEREVD